MQKLSSSFLINFKELRSLKMAQARCFSILGDSNVKRFVTLVNRRACPELESAQVLLCGRLALLSDALGEVRDVTDVVLVSCLTNFLTSASGSSSAALRVEPALLDFRSKIHDFCKKFPERFVLVFPPMYRSNPLWYRDELPEVLKRFSSVLSDQRPRNLILMSSFSSPSFESDGVHLTPYSGLEYLLFLFDSARDAIRLDGLEPEDRSEIGHEATRVLEDRMMVIEQDHRRISRAFDWKIAIDAEKEDFQENVRNEVFFMITGLSPIKGLSGKEWMSRAMSDVQGVIQILVGHEMPILVVHNASGRRETEVRYSVKMANVSDSQEIRHKFGLFFRGGQDRRPDSLRSVSISNKVTPGTQIRIMLMKLMAKRYMASNKGSKARVIGYEPRPMLKLIPSDTVKDRRIKNFTFIEAIKRMPNQFTSAELKPIYSKARVHFSACMRATFVVLNEDNKSEVPADTPESSVSTPADVDAVDVGNGEVDDVASDRVEDVSVVASSGSRKRRGEDTSSVPERQRSHR